MNGRTDERTNQSINQSQIESAERLLSDDRTERVRPSDGDEDAVDARTTYDAALANVRRRRFLRFRGMVRLWGKLLRMRIRAAERAYDPIAGGAGFAAAQASFQATASALQGSANT